MQNNAHFVVAATSAAAAAAASTARAEDAAARMEAPRNNFVSWQCLFLAAQSGFLRDVGPFLALGMETWG